MLINIFSPLLKNLEIGMFGSSKLSTVNIDAPMMRSIRIFGGIASYKFKSRPSILHSARITLRPIMDVVGDHEVIARIDEILNYISSVHTLAFTYHLGIFNNHNIWSVFCNLTTLRVSLCSGGSLLPNFVSRKLKSLSLSSVNADNEQYLKWVEDILEHSIVLEQLILYALPLVGNINQEREKFQLWNEYFLCRTLDNYQKALQNCRIVFYGSYMEAGLDQRGSKTSNYAKMYWNGRNPDDFWDGPFGV